MKKERPFIFTFLLVLSISLASAQVSFESVAFELSRLLDTVLRFISPFAEQLIGDYSSSEFFLHKLLLLVLLVVIVEKVLEKVSIIGNGKKAKKVNWILATLISILSIRFINENNFFEAIFLQYGILGIAITTVLPLMIFFFFVHHTPLGPTGRRTLWIIYIIITIGIWVSRADNIPDVANWLYGITIVVVIATILLDKTIHSYLGLGDFRLFERRQRDDSKLRKLRELDTLRLDHEAGRLSDDEFEKRRKEIRDYIEELEKE